MISIDNYFKLIKEMDITTFPPELKKGFEYVKEATENYTSWDSYYQYDVIKSKVNEFLAALNTYLNSLEHNLQPSVTNTSKQKARDIAKNIIWNHVQNGKTIQQLKIMRLGPDLKEYSAAIKSDKIVVNRIGDVVVNFSFPLESIYAEVLTEINPPATRAERKESEAFKERQNVELVERINEEVKFIKRYCSMNGKKKTDRQLLPFINALQKAIVDRRIRKHSMYKNEIQYMQTAIVNLYNELLQIPDPKKRIATIHIDKKVLENFLVIAGSEKIRPSINYLKRYIGIQGKNLTREKAVRLLELIKKAVEKRKVLSNDPYKERLNTIYESLRKFANTGKTSDTLVIHPAVLNGINEALDGLDFEKEELGCDCDKAKDSGFSALKTETEKPESGIMNSMDFAKLKFETLGFTGKWHSLIGDPCPGFNAMIFSKPKMGKSFFAIEFASYLAKNFGNVLYIAKEESLHHTLQIKFNELKAEHPSLYLSASLPENLKHFQFVFLDSVDTLKLSVDDLLKLKEENPGISFISIHQVTKEGKHRGSMEHQHNVDIIIEVPERGKVVQFGRFNQGGQMNIFKEDSEKSV